MTDDEWRALQAGFDTRQLLAALDDMDTLRAALSGNGLKPPEIRDQLLRLHGLAVKVVNEGSQRQAAELFDLASKLEDEAFDMLEAVIRLHKTFEALTALRPDSLDGSDGEDDGDGDGDGESGDDGEDDDDA